MSTSKGFDCNLCRCLDKCFTFYSKASCSCRRTVSYFLFKYIPAGFKKLQVLEDWERGLRIIRKKTTKKNSWQILLSTRFGGLLCVPRQLSSENTTTVHIQYSVVKEYHHNTYTVFCRLRIPPQYIYSILSSRNFTTLHTVYSILSSENTTKVHIQFSVV